MPRSRTGVILDFDKANHEIAVSPTYDRATEPAYVRLTEPGGVTVRLVGNPENLIKLLRNTAKRLASSQKMIDRHRELGLIE